MRTAHIFAAAFCALCLLACDEGPVGASCLESSECDTGLTCRQDFPGGYCTQGCEQPGTQSTCPVGTLCGEVLNGSLCVAICKSQDDCRDGYECGPQPNTDVLACRLRQQQAP